ncbi:hypothetical protein N9H93_02670 [Rhizobiaceae bacterium]|nr:hypothetical protein [Rhizobiaceae bacterium]
MAENSHGTGAPATHLTDYDRKMAARDVEIATGGRSRGDIMKEPHWIDSDALAGTANRATACPDGEGSGSAIVSTLVEHPPTLGRSVEIRFGFDSAVVIELGLLKGRVGMAMRRAAPEAVLKLLRGQAFVGDFVAKIAWNWLRDHGLLQRSEIVRVPFDSNTTTADLQPCNLSSCSLRSDRKPSELRCEDGGQSDA